MTNGDRNNRRNKAEQSASRCSLCSHRDRDEFDRGLALGDVSQAEVARLVGCNRSAVNRHVKRHLLPAVKKQAQADAELGGVSVLKELRGLYRRMKSHLDRAEQTDNWQAIRAFSAEARQDLELLSRLLGELESGATVNVLVSTEWLRVKTAIMEVMTAYPQAKEALAARLMEVG